jgi:hypothetical protein
MSLSRRAVLGLGAAGLSQLLLAQLGQRGQRANAAGTSGAPNGAAVRGLPSRGEQRLALISDLNSSYGSTSYEPSVHRGVQLLRQLRPDLVLCAGDMVAGQKRGLGSARLEAMWTAFDRQVLQPLRSADLPLAPTMGNHDASSSRGSDGRFVFELDRRSAAAFWRARQDQLGLRFVDRGTFPFRYSLRQGPVFVLVLDASSAAVPAADWRWAEAQLQAPIARQAALRLVMAHLPPYAVSQGRDRPGEVLQQPQRLLELLERHGAELAVSGHQHAWYPSRVGQANLLSLGAMGSGPRRLLGSNRAPQQTLTLLDLEPGGRALLETTVDLNSLQALSPGQLPASVQPSQGPRLQRRSGPIPLKPDPT